MTGTVSVAEIMVLLLFGRCGVKALAGARTPARAACWLGQAPGRCSRYSVSARAGMTTARPTRLAFRAPVQIAASTLSLEIRRAAAASSRVSASCSIASRMGLFLSMAVAGVGLDGGPRRGAGCYVPATPRAETGAHATARSGLRRAPDQPEHDRRA